MQDDFSCALAALHHHTKFELGGKPDNRDGRKHIRENISPFRIGSCDGFANGDQFCRVVKLLIGPCKRPPRMCGRCQQEGGRNRKKISQEDQNSYHNPMKLHQIGPIPIQRARFTTEITKPRFHQAFWEMYPEAK